MNQCVIRQISQPGLSTSPTTSLQSAKHKVPWCVVVKTLINLMARFQF